MYLYFKWADLIYTLTWYPMLYPPEFIRRELGRLLTRLGLRISEEGLGWKFGPMGFQTQHLKQEIINPEQVQAGK